MWFNPLKQIAKFLLIALVLAPTLLPLEAHAQIYEGVRNMHWNSSEGRCRGGGYNEITKKHTANVLDFNPLGNNPDYNFEMSNAICISYVASIGAGLLASKVASLYGCSAANPIGAGNMPLEFVAERATLSEVPYVMPGYVGSMINRNSQCAKRYNEVAIYTALAASGNPLTAASGITNLPIAQADAARCCTSLGIYAATLTGAVSGLGAMYGVANGAYEKARLCGNNWQNWEQDAKGNWSRGAFTGSYKQRVQQNYLSCVAKNGVGCTDASSGDSYTLGITGNAGKQYREYIFGGMEFEDSGEGACKSPWGSGKRVEILGYNSDNLRYYMTGPNAAPAYACYRYLLTKGSKSEIASGRAAYECCKKRSQSAICIENAANVVGPEGNNYDHTFCTAGSRCDVHGVLFESYISQKYSNHVCARTYSGCPYNHPLGGGTEIADYSDPKDPATIQNYCQYMNHCSILPIPPYVSRSSLTGAFFDSSCRDMKGDSQNAYGYSSSLVPVDVRGFSAPMAQCFKETMQNIFFNTAGSTVCLDPSETPDGSGQCSSGYKYKKGDDLGSYQRSIGQTGNSFFVRIQNTLQNTVKMALSIAIMFFGVSVLIGGSAITKKQMMPLIVKIAFVMFFAVDNWWQAPLMNGILGSSSMLADMTFRTDTITGSSTTGGSIPANAVVTNYSSSDNVPENKKDGCQFPKINYADQNEATKYNNAAYPPGKEYLRIWDTLDCKIARALGYGMEVSVPNLVMMILGGMITSGAGVVFVVATFAFAFFMIALTIRALHIFVLSTMSIVIMFYMAPIMVTSIMFTKTKGMFEKWWKNILSFALQPMILFAYMGILLTLFDTVIMGDVTFTGDGKSTPKQVICSGAAVDTSIYCIFNPPISGTNAGIKTYNELKMLGIGLPILTSMNATKISSLIKAAMLFFIFMTFLDKISGFAKSLTGGDVEAAAGGKTMTASQMLGKAHGALSGVQQRGLGALNKNVRPALGKMKDSAKEAWAKRGEKDQKEGGSAPRDAGSSTSVSSSDEKK